MKRFVSALLVLITCLSFFIGAAAQDDAEHMHSFECISVSEDYHTYSCECGEEFTEEHTFTDWQSNNDNGLFTSGTQTAEAAAQPCRSTEKRKRNRFRAKAEGGRYEKAGRRG